MTEADYERALKLIACVELDLRRYLNNPAEYQAEYLEDTHCCIDEVLTLLGVERIETHEEGEE